MFYFLKSDQQWRNLVILLRHLKNHENNYFDLVFLNQKSNSAKCHVIKYIDQTSTTRNIYIYNLPHYYLYIRVMCKDQILMVSCQKNINQIWNVKYNFYTTLFDPKSKLVPT